jgi:putative Mg2+ transporter-C (MgtC) family protein
MTSVEIMVFFGTRAFVAILAGLIVGIERTLSNHAAGIKTIVFVCLGSCLFTTLAFYLHGLYPQADPTRIIGQVVTGCGFLGAGVVFYNNEKVNGLTSAAIIWFSCAEGTIAGSGLVLIPILAAITMVIILVFLKKLEKLLEKFKP